MISILKKIGATASMVTVTLIVACAFLEPVFVSAQTTPAANATAVPANTSEFGAPVNTSYTLLEPLPCIAGTGNNCTAGSSVSSINIQTYIIYIFKLMIALAVLATVVMCIIGGFEYMLSESVTSKEDAKNTIKNAVLGLLGALASYLILYTINPNLVNVGLVTVPKLNLAATNINLNASGVVDAQSEGYAQAAQANIKDNALDQQAQTAQSNADNLYNQLYQNGCIDENGDPSFNKGSQCQSDYATWTQAQTSADTAASTAITTRAQDSFAVNATNANIAGGGTVADMVRNESNNTAAYNTAMASLKANNDIAGEQALMQSYNQAQMPLENQAAVLNYQNAAYPSEANADAAKAAALSTIASDSTTAIKNATDPTVKQNLIANQKSAIAAINNTKPQITNTTVHY